jgi:hypothetical protein
MMALSVMTDVIAPSHTRSITTPKRGKKTRTPWSYSKARLNKRHFKCGSAFWLVMPGLVPGIHVLAVSSKQRTWMAGTSPAMTGMNVT